jgi:hypothetical protein
MIGTIASIRLNDRSSYSVKLSNPPKHQKPNLNFKIYSNHQKDNNQLKFKRGLSKEQTRTHRNNCPNPSLSPKNPTKTQRAATKQLLFHTCLVNRPALNQHSQHNQKLANPNPTFFTTKPNNPSEPIKPHPPHTRHAKNKPTSTIKAA